MLRKDKSWRAAKGASLAVAVMSLLMVPPLASADNEDTALKDNDATQAQRSGKQPRFPIKTSRQSKILSEIHQTNEIETGLGKLAQERGSSKEVKDYGKQLVNDHRDADKKLRELVQNQNIPLIEIPPKSEQKATMTRLRSLEGEQFDREFLKVMERDHRKTVQMLESARSELGPDSKVGQLISQMLPTLKSHESHAELLQQRNQQAGETGSSKK